jgi:uncharacterized membrane protein YedE/YeeE
MRTFWPAFASGALFGAGLTVSHMVNPAKVAAFLDFAGRWDPSLALVMGGALAVTAAAYRWTLRRSAPLCAPAFRLPAATRIDARLIVGSALFGVGWGLGGFCPGPAIASLGYGATSSLLFVAAMLLGMLGWEWRPAARAVERAFADAQGLATPHNR